MKKILFLIVLVSVFGDLVNAQNLTSTGRNGSSPKNEAQWDTSYAHNLDTLYYTLPIVNINASLPRKFTNKHDQKKYYRLVYHVKKVYPYAKRAGEMLKEEEAKMAGLNKGDRKAHMKAVERRIEKEFGPELKNLTFTQGTILLKLIDRETGYTSYELLDDLRGTFRAWFYDGIAGLFGYDLKGDFDPHKNLEDRYIDELVRMIEVGQL